MRYIEQIHQEDKHPPMWNYVGMTGTFAPMIDLGEGSRHLDSPEAMAARGIGTPATNPNYFKDLMGE